MNHAALVPSILSTVLLATALPCAADDWAAALADRLSNVDGVETVLVSRQGEVLAERGAPDVPTNVKSASKSLLSALVGIAVEEEIFSSLDQPVAELLPAAFAEAGSREKRRITVRHLLTMTAGLESTSGLAYGRWVASDSWVEAALGRPLLDRPGTKFRYSTGNTHLLSAALTEASGRSTLELARTHLLGPAGIAVADWQRGPEGYYFGGNNLSMTPRDLLRLGWLYLRAGRAGDRQVVPRAWVEASTRVHSAGWPDRYGQYGFGWWIRPRHAFMAVGFGGQFLYADPRTGAAVVVISTSGGKRPEWDRRVIGIIEDGLPGR